MSIPITREDKTSEAAARMASVILIAGGMFCTLILLYVAYDYGWAQNKGFAEWEGMLVYYGVPALTAALCFLACRLPSRIQIKLALLILSTGVSVYAAETMLNAVLRMRSVVDYKERQARVIAAQESGLSFDSRTTLEVVRDLRRKGVEAYPFFTSTSLLREEAKGSRRSKLSIDGKEFLPLGGISNKTTVLCTERGPYVVFKSDAHGFRNPEGIWNGGRADIVALGDSFTQGFCVPDNETFVDRIREVYPATLSVGVAGHGPLLMLASLREYAKPMRPKAVMWFYYEGNDLQNLSVAKNSALLRRYMAKDDFSQGLFDRQADVDRALKPHFEAVINESRASRMLREITQVASPGELLARKWSILKLTRLRGELGLVYGDGYADPGEDENFAYAPELDLFARILSRAKRSVREWGGELYFVYLPQTLRYMNPKRAQQSRDGVLDVAKSVGLPVIDIHPVFASQDDPLGLFPFRMRGHYNEAGNRLVAEEVMRSISLP